MSDPLHGGPTLTAAPGPPRRRRARAQTAPSSEYSPALARLGAFTLRHKALVIGLWIGTAVVLAVLFPQLETVVRQQSVDLVPHDAPSFLTVDRMSAPYVQGATIDFVDTIEKQGFTIDNPNATGSCACGDSFN